MGTCTPVTSFHPALQRNPADRSLEWAPAEDLCVCARVSLNLRRGRFSDISKLPCFSSLFISNKSFLPSCHPQSCLRGEGVRAGGHVQPGFAHFLTPTGSRQSDQLSTLFWDTELPGLQPGNSQTHWDTLVTLSRPYSRAGRVAFLKKSVTTAKKKGPGTLS